MKNAVLPLLYSDIVFDNNAEKYYAFLREAHPASLGMIKKMTFRDIKIKRGEEVMCLIRADERMRNWDQYCQKAQGMKGSGKGNSPDGQGQGQGKRQSIEVTLSTGIKVYDLSAIGLL